MTKRWMIAATLMAALVGASGCGDAGTGDVESIEGDWAGVEPVDQSHNELVLRAGGEGSATVYIFRVVDNEPQASPFTFDVGWEQTDDQVDVEMTCDESPFGECEPEDDVSMSCLVSGSPLTMSCEADGRWADYDFRYEKQ